MTDDAAATDARQRISDAMIALRTAENLTQEELGSLLHMSRSAIANAERGKATVAIVERIVSKFPDFAAVAESFISSQKTRSRRKVPENDDLEEMLFRRSNLVADLSGEWHALWETTVEGEPLLNSEVLRFEQVPRNRLRISNIAISPENPEGGYLWTADCRMYDNQFILGIYIATEASIRSKGVLQLSLRPSGREIEGRWAGASFDSNFSQGLVVMTRRIDERDHALTRFREQMARNGVK